MQNEPDFARLLEEYEAAGAEASADGTPDIEAGIQALAEHFLTEDTEGGGAPQPATAPETAAPEPELTAEQKALTPGYYLEHGEPGLAETGAGQIAEAALGGAAKAAFETGDFLFGEVAPADRSALRSGVEARVDHLKEQSLVAGFSAGIGQWATGMFGAGKITGAAKVLPWFGKGLGALGNLRGARAAGEMARAATVGVVAFDPHEERLANLIESTPLANPITQWLAADPTDTVAEGRMKAALESIGMDLAIVGTFAAAGKVWKALRLGDETSARKAVEEAEAEIAAASRPVEAEPLKGNSRGAEGPLGDAPSPAAVPEPEGQPLASPIADAEAVPSRTMEAAAEPTPSVSGPANAADEGADLVPSPMPGAPDTAAAPAFRPSATYTDEDTLAVLNGAQRDADALDEHGGWYQAIQAGHTFGRGEGIPYVKLNQDAAVEDFMARAVDAVEERLSAIKGGEVLTDAAVSRMVAQRARLFGEDPTTVMGMLQQSGDNAGRMVADMEAGYLITHRMFQDTNALAQRINAGDFTEFGSREAAVEELKHRLSLASSIYGASRSITANAGRALRRMRTDFKLRPEDLANLQEMDGNQLVQMIVNTNGDPKALARAANPTFWQRTMNAVEYVYVNNLVSGPFTQGINLLSNSAMVGLRPLERMLGGAFKAAAGNPEGRNIVTEAAVQYGYLGGALVDGFRMAAKTWKLNDSVLAPFGTEYYRPNQAAAEAGPAGFKPWTSSPNVLHNVYRAAFQAIGTPTRALGYVDELVKQTVYRSKVQARAYVEATAEGTAAGLKGAELDAFVTGRVEDRLAASFDELGRGIDPRALREANVSTFQQDLPEDARIGRIGQFAQRTLPGMKLVLPFVKTPTNVLRYGWKLTPGLNALQTEYRRALRGMDGQEAQAQAYGQMALGVTFMGAAATLAANGMVTGGGPSDPKLRQELAATGWKPYSFVRTHMDGSKSYHGFNRFDPFAMPFGIVADLQDMVAAWGDGEEEMDGATAYVSAGIGALAVSLTQQFREKAYLQGLAQTLEAIMEPEDRGPNLIGQTAANFIPFSAFLRQTNVGDPYLREARSVVDRMMATVPGLSETVPARYDAFGDPVVARRGMWSTDSGSAVDAEMQRLALVNGSALLRVNPRPQAGVDLREITMADGSNAYETYQRLAGHLPGDVSLKEIVAEIIATEEYQMAPDGDRATKGTKLWLLEGEVQDYRQAAMREIRMDPNVAAALERRQNKVWDHYDAQQTPTARPGPRAPDLLELGAAFGVDLAPRASAQ